MNKQEFWDGVHDAKQANEVSWFKPSPKTSLELIELSRVAKERPVLDVGGGVGFLVDRLIEREYADIHVLDISAKALGQTRARLGPREAKVHWIIDDILKAPLPEVALWHDRAVFHFLIDDAEQQAYVDLVENTVTSDGCVIIATFAEDGPDKCSGLPVRRYSIEELGKTFPTFNLVQSVKEVHVTPWGAEQTFNYALFRRK